ncbi:hypothetical protein TrST_g2603 [Triparma strigata]|uniref:Uncharacterized protein n=1 Tax=Triparma strigata TaxID=1606541 RepID=A0A9W7AKG8_9STRA|nr:hypothetical protein TrST_g2603 [Triparma strigata]
MGSCTSSPDPDDTHPSVKGLTHLKSVRSSVSTDDKNFWAKVDVSVALGCSGINDASFDFFLQQYKIEGILVCNWQDQGWGNQKGNIMIASGDLTSETEWEYLKKSAPHDGEEVNVIIPEKFVKNQGFILGYTVGGGGGHSLKIWNARIRFVSREMTEIQATVVIQSAFRRSTKGIKSPANLPPPPPTLRKTHSVPTVTFAQDIKCKQCKQTLTKPYAFCTHCGCKQ